ncbi:helix-turn-helix transcriptional regulator [Streptomyces sp. 3N207]|uniref:helix-turn-helix transcriptional regulator n=1 Tax=Streptomyces sp. 3N207 TaxID=3457417 RepID=UPI003FD10382
MTAATIEQRLSEVEALLAGSRNLPSPALRAALREAGGLNKNEVAKLVGVQRLQVYRWEHPGMNVEPRPPHRAVYARLLRGLAEKHPSVVAEFEFASHGQEGRPVVT